MDDLVTSIEPYTSYRYVLGLVLFGMTLYFIVTSIMSLRNLRGLLDDLNNQVNDKRLFDDVRMQLDPDCDLSKEQPLKAKPGRIIKLSMLSACLRLFGFRTLISVFPELVAIVALGAASAAAYWYVFFTRV